MSVTITVEITNKLLWHVSTHEVSSIGSTLVLAKITYECTCRSSLFVISTIIVTDTYVYSLVELKIIKKCTVPLLRLKSATQSLHFLISFPLGKTAATISTGEFNWPLVIEVYLEVSNFWRSRKRCECKNLIPTVVEFLNLCQDGTNVSM